MAKTATLPFIKESPYLTKLQTRKRSSRVYRRYQAVGLALAVLLRDRKHKALYIKLAKQYPVDFLLTLAKDISQRKQVVKPGAYFMKVFREEVSRKFIKNKIKNNNLRPKITKHQLKLEIRKSRKK